MSGNNSLKARTPAALAGLCRGANKLNSSTFSKTSPSTTVDSLKYSPPATTRCPTPVISS
ncbi:Uncharacterised protein [Streptococcus pneumoniae]|nr:Uncharacterised protein [Streptococcus pneumoniae]